jgi:23S rRNA (guanosine2251-2'-O)-methyltransferase
MLTLRNPHSVLAAIEARPGDLVDVRLPQGRAHGAWELVAAAAHRLGRPIVSFDPEARRGPREGGGRAGAEARLQERMPLEIEELFPDAGPGDLWLAFDEVQDPHNVGAIFRTAAFFGVRGIVMTDVRAAPLTSVVYDVASGGVEAVPFAIEKNLRRALKGAKDAGVWILGSSEHATREVADLPRDRPWLLVVGNEESGLRRLTLDTCDEVCRIAPRGRSVTSLNVSVAAGVMIAALSSGSPAAPGS